MTTYTGSCLCGCITYEAEGEPGRLFECYCNWCQKKYNTYRNVVVNREHDVKRKAILDWFKDFRRYLSLKDTKTLCKSCAYIEDMVDE